MKQYIILVRGVPGSGKSTFSREAASNFGCKHFEADMFFTDMYGNYNYDAKRIAEAHNWCFAMAKAEIDAGASVIVANTFVYKKHMRPYYDMANARGIQAVEIKMRGNFKNIHGVPENIVDKMRREFEE